MTIDERYQVVHNIKCPSCFQGVVETVVKIVTKDKKIEYHLVYAQCDPYKCNFNHAQRAKLLEKSLELMGVRRDS